MHSRTSFIRQGCMRAHGMTRALLRGLIYFLSISGYMVLEYSFTLVKVCVSFYTGTKVLLGKPGYNKKQYS